MNAGLPWRSMIPGRNGGRVRPQTPLHYLGVMLHDVEIVIFRIAAIYPRHATLDLFGVRVHAGTLDARYGALVPVLDRRQHFPCLPSTGLTGIARQALSRVANNPIPSYGPIT